MESHFIIGKKGKEQIINDFKENLSLSDEEADTLYNTCMDIIGNEVKDGKLDLFEECIQGVLEKRTINSSMQEAIDTFVDTICNEYTSTISHTEFCRCLK